jgi:hypothetical protein
MEHGIFAQLNRHMENNSGQGNGPGGDNWKRIERKRKEGG